MSLQNVVAAIEQQADELGTSLNQVLQVLQDIQSGASASADGAPANAGAGFASLDFSSNIIGIFNSLKASITGLVAPFQSSIALIEQYNQQLLQSQIAYIAATKQYDLFGNSINQFADRVEATRGKFSSLIDEIEISTQDIVGLTSSRLSNILTEVIQESSSVLSQYTSEVASNDLDAFKKLTENLAATFSLIGSPEYQDPQEVRSLLLGQVNNSDAFAAQRLNIDSNEVQRAMAEGRYVDLLIEKTEVFRAASSSAASSYTNVLSNIQEVQEQVQRSLGKPIASSVTQIAGDFFNYLSTTDENIKKRTEINLNKGLISIDENIGREQLKLNATTDPDRRLEIEATLEELEAQRQQLTRNVDPAITQYSGTITERKLQLESAESGTTDETAIDKLKDYAEKFGLAVSDAIQSIYGYAKQAVNLFNSLGTLDLIKGGFQGFANGIKAASNVINILSQALGKVSEIVENVVPAIEPVFALIGESVGFLLGFLTVFGLLYKASALLVSGFTGLAAAVGRASVASSGMAARVGTLGVIGLVAIGLFAAWKYLDVFADSLQETTGLLGLILRPLGKLLEMLDNASIPGTNGVSVADLRSAAQGTVNLEQFDSDRITYRMVDRYFTREVQPGESRRDFVQQNLLAPEETTEYQQTAVVINSLKSMYDEARLAQEFAGKSREEIEANTQIDQSAKNFLLGNYEALDDERFQKALANRVETIQSYFESFGIDPEGDSIITPGSSNKLFGEDLRTNVSTGLATFSSIDNTAAQGSALNTTFETFVDNVETTLEADVFPADELSSMADDLQKAFANTALSSEQRLQVEQLLNSVIERQAELVSRLAEKAEAFANARLEAGEITEAEFQVTKAQSRVSIAEQSLDSTRRLMELEEERTRQSIESKQIEIERKTAEIAQAPELVKAKEEEIQLREQSLTKYEVEINKVGSVQELTQNEQVDKERLTEIARLVELSSSERKLNSNQSEVRDIIKEDFDKLAAAASTDEERQALSNFVFEDANIDERVLLPLIQQFYGTDGNIRAKSVLSDEARLEGIQRANAVESSRNELQDALLKISIPAGDLQVNLQRVNKELVDNPDNQGLNLQRAALEYRLSLENELKSLQAEVETATPSRRRRLEERIEQVQTDLQSDPRKEIEQDKEAIASQQEESDNLRQASLNAAIQEAITAEKLLQNAKVRLEYADELLKIESDILQSKKALAEVELRRALSPTPELYEPTVAEQEFKEAVESQRLAETNVEIAREQLSVKKTSETVPLITTLLEEDPTIAANFLNERLNRTDFNSTNVTEFLNAAQERSSTIERFKSGETITDVERRSLERNLGGRSLESLTREELDNVTSSLILDSAEGVELALQGRFQELAEVIGSAEVQSAYDDLTSAETELLQAITNRAVKAKELASSFANQVLEQSNRLRRLEGVQDLAAEDDLTPAQLEVRQANRSYEQAVDELKAYQDANNVDLISGLTDQEKDFIRSGQNVQGISEQEFSLLSNLLNSEKQLTDAEQALALEPTAIAVQQVKTDTALAQIGQGSLAGKSEQEIKAKQSEVELALAEQQLRLYDEERGGEVDNTDVDRLKLVEQVAIAAQANLTAQTEKALSEMVNFVQTLNRELSTLDSLVSGIGRAESAVSGLIRQADNSYEFSRSSSKEEKESIYSVDEYARREFPDTVSGLAESIEERKLELEKQQEVIAARRAQIEARIAALRLRVVEAELQAEKARLEIAPDSPEKASQMKALDTAITLNQEEQKLQTQVISLTDNSARIAESNLAGDFSDERVLETFDTAIEEYKKQTELLSGILDRLNGGDGVVEPTPEPTIRQVPAGTIEFSTGVTENLYREEIVPALPSVSPTFTLPTLPTIQEESSNLRPDYTKSLAPPEQQSKVQQNNEERDKFIANAIENVNSRTGTLEEVLREQTKILADINSNMLNQVATESEPSYVIEFAKGVTIFSKTIEELKSALPKLDASTNTSISTNTSTTTITTILPKTLEDLSSTLAKLKATLEKGMKVEVQVNQPQPSPQGISSIPNLPPLAQNPPGFSSYPNNVP